MKKIFIASGLLALMAAATSCDKYDIYDDQYGDILMIKDAGDQDLTLYSTDDHTDLAISVMKGGHTPGRDSKGTIRLMTAEDFDAYRDETYGNPKFKGLQMVDRSLYDLVYTDANGVEQTVDAISHDFAGENDRYINVTLRVKAKEYANWYRDVLTDLEKVDEYVIPVGLYSDTDSVNYYSQSLIIHPSDTDPVITCDVTNGSYNITDLSRRQLLKDQVTGAGYFEPEVYMNVPCQNPWGITLALADPKSSNVSNFNNDSKNTITLTSIKKANYEIASSMTIPAGEQKARIPLKISLDSISPDDDLDKNLVVPVEIKKKDCISFESEVDELAKERLSIENMVVYLGCRVVEDPLELNDGNVTSNDCEPTEGSIAALFDDNLSTFFHSGWTVAFERTAPYGSYLEIALPEPINACFFNITARNTNQCSPKTIHLYYTNEEPPATGEEDTRNWIFFKEAKNSKKLGAGQSFEIGKINAMFQAPETFNYMRFCVIENDKGESLLSPSKSIYWNLAELRMYGRIQ